MDHGFTQFRGVLFSRRRVIPFGKNIVASQLNFRFWCVVVGVLGKATRQAGHANHAERGGLHTLGTILVLRKAMASVMHILDCSAPHRGLCVVIILSRVLHQCRTTTDHSLQFGTNPVRRFVASAKSCWSSFEASPVPQPRVGWARGEGPASAESHRTTYSMGGAIPATPTSFSSPWRPHGRSDRRGLGPGCASRCQAAVQVSGPQRHKATPCHAALDEFEQLFEPAEHPSCSSAVSSDKTWTLMSPK